MSETSEAPTADGLLAEWRRLMDERDQADEAYEEQIKPFQAEYEAKIEPLKERLNEIEAWFLLQAEATGAEAFASDDGTVTVSVRESPKITDAESFFAWAASSNNVSLLQKRISVTQFREFVKDNPDQVPPGVTVEQDRSAKFKRP